jgi:hypothetical protein
MMDKGDTREPAIPSTLSVSSQHLQRQFEMTGVGLAALLGCITARRCLLRLLQ